MKINRTVQRSLHILSMVAQAPKGLTLKDLEEQLAIPKTSLFDIVSTLVAMHYLRKSDHLFFIGRKCREIGSAYAQKQDLCDVAEPLLTQASERNNISSSLVLLSANDLDYCFQYHPEDAVMIARKPSSFGIHHASATGKVLLAYMQPARRDALLKKMTFHKFTDRTIDNTGELLKALEAVRKQGYALDDREYHYLLQCVAAPIYFQKKVIAAISFSGLNLYNDDPAKMVEEVLETAKEISTSYAQA
ncbi:IclR family transcriptional regulator [Salidesulfovibrio onnuriiensis]|uniref:IclR family transcriptional regulator n=1 Tax=Salidesulfovibrio onnuriiensis TaxID=2583823 RepID=UPI0011C96D1F|nr:IclR family transcriptional regulator [Salidesulfovibrio onnuriiensis]